MRKRPQNNGVTIALLGVIAMALLGGCTPIDTGEVETFVRELLLNTMAAFLF